VALLALGTTKADPETVDGLLKKNTNTWQVPIVAKQPNENKPTQVIGGYPQLEPDTLARPLKAKQGLRRAFGQYFKQTSSSEASSNAGIPEHILQWLAARGQTTATTTTTAKTSAVKPQQLSNLEQVKKPVQRSSASSTWKAFPNAEEGLLKVDNQLPHQLPTTTKPKLIQRPAYNPSLAGDDNVAAKTENASTITAEESVSTKEDEENLTFSPRVAALMMDDYLARKKDKLSVAGLVIGLTFVAAFIAIAIGLVGHGMIKRCRHVNSDNSGRSSRNSWMRSPGDEDRTPPELRPGSNCSGHHSSRRNSARTRHIPGTLPGHGGTPFFNGKLILHDPPGLANGARGVVRPFNPGNVLSNSGTGFMMSSPPSVKLGAIPKKMPSPAAQVTDILVSPKYEDGETTEEEDSDDTVYECPGLGATRGMEVRNPFFMGGGAGGSNLQPTSGLANKKPISQYTDLFHHQEIMGLN